MNKLVPLMNKFRILLGVIFLLLFTISAFYLGQQFSKKSKKQSCTQEAKVCPDGSTVSRTGPNCEFAPCPTLKPSPIINETASWKSYINKKFNYAIKFPRELIVGNGIDPESAFEYVDNLYLTDKTGNFVDIFHENNPNKLTVDDWLRSDRGQIYNFNNSTPSKVDMSALDWYAFNPPLTFSLDSSAFKWGLFYSTEVFLVGNKTGLDDNTLETILSTFKFLD